MSDQLPKPPFDVCCVRGWGDLLQEGAPYRVAVVVNDGMDYRGHAKGFILYGHIASDVAVWPYVWDAKRFEVLEAGES